MALNFKSGQETQSALTEATSGTAIDLAGYSKLGVSLIFGTCTGTTNTSTVILQTSNDNSNWHTMSPNLASETDCENYDSDTYFEYWPGDDTDQKGFGRYVRFRLTGTGTFSVSYTVKWLAKE
jgi:hypothetical protein